MLCQGYIFSLGSFCLLMDCVNSALVSLKVELNVDSISPLVLTHRGCAYLAVLTFLDDLFHRLQPGFRLSGRLY